jgi:hypothetical protein
VRGRKKSYLVSVICRAPQSIVSDEPYGAFDIVTFTHRAPTVERWSRACCLKLCLVSNRAWLLTLHLDQCRHDPTLPGSLGSIHGRDVVEEDERRHDSRSGTISLHSSPRDLSKLPTAASASTIVADDH